MLQFHGWKKTGLLSAVWLRAQVHKTVATHSPRRLVCLRLRPDTKTNPPQWEEGASLSPGRGISGRNASKGWCCLTAQLRLSTLQATPTLVACSHNHFSFSAR
ncbi:hypothetical protein V1521DRAFT_425789 [Lipomyces starkeyi]